MISSTFPFPLPEPTRTGRFGSSNIPVPYLARIVCMPLSYVRLAARLGDDIEFRTNVVDMIDQRQWALWERRGEVRRSYRVERQYDLQHREETRHITSRTSIESSCALWFAPGDLGETDYGVVRCWCLGLRHKFRSLGGNMHVLAITWT